MNIRPNDRLSYIILFIKHWIASSVCLRLVFGDEQITSAIPYFTSYPNAYDINLKFIQKIHRWNKKYTYIYFTNAGQRW